MSYTKIKEKYEAKIKTKFNLPSNAKIDITYDTDNRDGNHYKNTWVWRTDKQKWELLESIKW